MILYNKGTLFVCVCVPNHVDWDMHVKSTQNTLMFGCKQDVSGMLSLDLMILLPYL